MMCFVPFPTPTATEKSETPSKAKDMWEAAKATKTMWDAKVKVNAVLLDAPVDKDKLYVVKWYDPRTPHDVLHRVYKVKDIIRMVDAITVKIVSVREVGEEVSLEVIPAVERKIILGGIEL